MRRPGFCAEFRVENMSQLSQATDSGEESAFGRVKRIFSSQLGGKYVPASTQTFGVPLDELVMRASRQGYREGVPTVVIRLCRFIENHGLQMEGLFRISGNQRNMEKMRATFDRVGDIDLEGIGDVMSAAGLLKLFLRELPSPPIPDDLAWKLVRAQQKHVHNPEQCLFQLRQLVRQLPPNNFSLLKYLASFLSRVTSFEEDNRMSGTSLGIVFAPNLFRIGSGFDALRDTAVTNQLTTSFVLHYSAIFEADGEELLNGNNERQRENHVDSADIAGKGRKISEKELKCRRVCPDHNAKDTATPGGSHSGGGGSGMDKSAVEERPGVVDHHRELVNICASPSAADHLFLGTRPEICSCADSLYRKRKERYESSSQGHDRKVIRSNSEEQLLHLTLPAVEGRPLRRSSSHDNLPASYCSAGSGQARKSILQELIDTSNTDGGRPYGLVLQDLPPSNLPINLSSPSSQEDVASPSFTVGGEPEDEHELRRNSERFATFPATPCSKKKLRKVKKTQQKGRGSSSSKENDYDDDKPQKQRVGYSGYPMAMLYTQQSCSSTSDDDSNQESGPTHAFLELHPQRSSEEQEQILTPSPTTPRKVFVPPLDLMSLHEQMEGSEPVSSQTLRGSWNYEPEAKEDKVMLSPRNSLILISEPYPDHSVPPSPPMEHDLHRTKWAVTMAEEDASSSRIKQLTKQINSLKKKVKQFEESFERDNGYRPSHADKLGNREVKKHLSELSKARKELRVIKEDPSSLIGYKSRDSVHSDAFHLGSRKLCAKLEDTLAEVLKRLSDKRKNANRPEDLDELSHEQILEEKVSMQKALLYFESIHGRPTTKEEKDLMRPLYDRYRSLKRLVIKSGSSKSKENIVELATIVEGQQMDFTQASPQHRLRLETPSKFVSSETVSSVSGIDREIVPRREMDLPDFKRQKKIAELGENLHALPLSELTEQRRLVREEKKKLRRNLREFEDDFQRTTGRKVQKDDRTVMEATYNQYKQAKAKLRLLDALVAKH